MEGLGNVLPVERRCALPPVDGGVTLSEPADPRQLVLLTSSTKIHDHIVLSDHQIQSSHHVPAGRHGR